MGIARPHYVAGNIHPTAMADIAIGKGVSGFPLMSAACLCYNLSVVNNTEKYFIHPVCLRFLKQRF